LAQRASKAGQPPDLCACERWHNQAGLCYDATPPQPSLRTHAAPTCLPAGAGAAPKSWVAWIPACRDPWASAPPAATCPDAGARLASTAASETGLARGGRLATMLPLAGSPASSPTA
jgi:hypothetical protein